MANRAKLTLVPKQVNPDPKQESTPGERSTGNVDSQEVGKKPSAAGPFTRSGLAKGLLLAGLTVVSLVIFKRKIL